MNSNQNHHIIISIGCNIDCDIQMKRAKECLSEAFPGVRFTSSVMSPAYGMGDDIPPYSNSLAECETALGKDNIIHKLKEMENYLGDDATLRQDGKVMMDLDLLKYDEIKCHINDWERPYIKKLLTMLLSLLIMVCIPTVLHAQQVNNNKAEKDLLAKAVEYYQGQKYHESILAFEKLQKKYRLNPRFICYLGYSYYKENKYSEAVRYLVEAVPEMTAYSPLEQAIFIYACAESLFNLQRYAEAIDYYEKAIPLVNGNNKGDVCYHTAFSYFMLYQRNPNGDFLTKASHYFSEACIHYSKQTQSNPLHKARLAQAQIMLKALLYSSSEEQSLTNSE